MNRIYHIGISGGKDSTALLLWMIHESGIPRAEIVASFCDTQNEAAETYAHIEMLSKEVFPIERIATPGFNALVVKYKIFPNAHRRYCTKELKLIPTKHYLEALSEKHDEIIACSGIRRGESEDRRKMTEWGNPLESYFGLKEWRPLIDWTIRDILAIHSKYNIPLNPLYLQGAKRVGCFPCIHSSKAEIRGMVAYHPARIGEIRELEAALFEMSGQPQTFFASSKVPLDYRSETYIKKDGTPVKVCSIDDVVRWAKSGYRGDGAAPDINGLFDDQLKDLPPSLCLAHSMACE